MGKKAPKEQIPSLKDWATEAVSKCKTCIKHPDLLEDIRTFLRMRADGDTKKSYSALHEYLRLKGYSLQLCSLKSHISTCERELYGEVQKARQ